jgi:hypothetical protein
VRFEGHGARLRNIGKRGIGFCRVACRRDQAAAKPSIMNEWSACTDTPNQSAVAC